MSELIPTLIISFIFGGVFIGLNLIILALNLKLYTVFQGKGKGEMNKLKFLNIYGQPFHHVEAQIVGNLAALEELYDALEEVFTSSDRKVKTKGLFTTDGEGYDIEIILLPDNPLDPAWKEYEPEYTSYLKGIE